jgi:hypothetical protein
MTVPRTPSSTPVSPHGDVSASPFRLAADPGPRSTLKRWLGISDSAKARRVLENRLAAAAPEAPPPDQLSQTLLDYGIGGKQARAILGSFFRRALEHAVPDDRIDSVENTYLDRLRRTFGISDAELAVVHEEVLNPRLAAEIREVIADDYLSGADRARVDRLIKNLRLSPAASTQLYQVAGQHRMSAAVRDATADSRLSPEEEAALHALARNLGAELTVDASTQATLERMRLLWRIDNGDLPAIPVPINLQRGEVCHAHMEAVWHEHRTRTETVGYSGFSTSVRICKGLRYRVSTVRPNRVTREELVQVDAGVLYLTNKRLIFDGQRKNTTFRLSSLLGFTPFADAVQLEKASGRPPILVLSGGDVEIFHSMLSAALSNA